MTRLRIIIGCLVAAALLLPGLCVAQSGATVPAVARLKSATESQAAIPSSNNAEIQAKPAGTPHDYVLGAGDRVQLTVYGEADLSGEFEIGSTGAVALPLIGNVDAAGLTVADFERAVQTRLANGYLKDPRASAQVINYRPFFILGEVTKPGSYPYVNGMTVLNAVALAGGYTYRAGKSSIVVVRANDPDKKEADIDENSPVMPGDVIRVPERFF